MTTDKVYNLIILDQSTSMRYIKKATISGFNELVQTTKGIEKMYPEQQHFISFVVFNGQGVKTHLDKQPVSYLAQLDEKSYQLSYQTPLYDAIGLSVTNLRLDLAGQENVNVLVTILTDGEDNASKEFNLKRVKSIVEEQKTKGWTFTYIGANQNVEKVAGTMSITNTMHFEANTEDVKAMFEREKTSRMRYYTGMQNNNLSQENFYMDPNAPVEKDII